MNGWVNEWGRAWENPWTHWNYSKRQCVYVHIRSTAFIRHSKGARIEKSFRTTSLASSHSTQFLEYLQILRTHRCISAFVWSLTSRMKWNKSKITTACLCSFRSWGSKPVGNLPQTGSPLPYPSSSQHPSMLLFIWLLQKEKNKAGEASCSSRPQSWNT